MYASSPTGLIHRVSPQFRIRNGNNETIYTRTKCGIAIDDETWTRFKAFGIPEGNRCDRCFPQVS